MAKIIVPFNIRTYRGESADEMSTRNPLDTEKVKFLDGALVPTEVYDDVVRAAEARGVDVAQYLVDVAFRAALYDLAGSDND